MTEHDAVDRLAPHLLALCRACVLEGATGAQINALMPKLVAAAEVMAATDDRTLDEARQRLRCVQGQINTRIH